MTEPEKHIAGVEFVDVAPLLLPKNSSLKSRALTLLKAAIRDLEEIGEIKAHRVRRPKREIRDARKTRRGRIDTLRLMAFYLEGRAVEPPSNLKFAIDSQSNEVIGFQIRFGENNSRQT